MSECSVCLEVIGARPGNHVNTECGHKFCKECIDNWFDCGKNSCPMCRAEIKYIDLGGERVRILRPQNAPHENPMIINFERYYLLARWIWIQWFALIVFGVIIFTIIYENIDLTEENNELMDENDSLRELIEDMDDNKIMTSIRVIDGSHWSYQGDYLHCNIPSYYIDQCQ
jgi:hypothetical protein